MKFGSIAKAAPKAKEAYPVLPASPEIKTMVDWLVANADMIDRIASVKKQLAEEAQRFYFQQGNGKASVPSTVVIEGTQEDVGVTFSDRYGTIDESGVESIVGGLTSSLFRQAFTISIDGDKIPVDAVQQLVDELTILFGAHQASDALAVKDGLAPVDDFHSRRHMVLSVNQNLALQAGPAKCVAAVKLRKK